MQVVEKGLRFTMREGNKTLGYGVITEILPEVDLEEYELERKKLKKIKAKEDEIKNQYK